MISHMGRLLVAATLASMTVLVAGCSKTDWFGNDPAPTGPVGCDVRDEGPLAQPNPLKPAPRPGTHQMTISVEVLAATYRLVDGKYSRELDHGWCAPFDFTVTARVPQMPQVPTFIPRGGVPHTVPYSGAGRTPWFADAILAWDARDQPPHVEVGIMATYNWELDRVTGPQPDKDQPDNVGRVAFRCAIRINGGIHPIVIDMDEDVHAVGGGFVRCDLAMMAIPG